MTIRDVRAVLNLKTPHGDLRKSVNWSFYEMRALCTPSSTAEEALAKFLKVGDHIIRSCYRDLYYLDTIYFFEEQRSENAIFYKKKNRTQIAKVSKNKDGTIRIMML